jgi:hypothetical protein
MVQSPLLLTLTRTAGNHLPQPHSKPGRKGRYCLGIPNLYTLTKLSGYALAIVDLEIMSLPDLQPAFLRRMDLSLAALAGNGAAGEAGR